MIILTTVAAAWILASIVCAFTIGAVIEERDKQVPCTHGPADACRCQL